MNIKFRSVCTIDATGRLVIPAVLRKMLNIVAYDTLTITVTDEGIILSNA